MYKGKDLVGRKIINRETSEQVDTVEDVVFNTETKQVTAFLIDEGGLISSAQVVPVSMVSTIGADAIVVADSSAVQKVSDLEEVNSRIDKDQVAVGTKLMTEDGREVGKITDIYFDETTYNLLGFEVSGGLYKDLMNGKSYLPLPASIRIGDEYAFVPNETAVQLDVQVSGIKGQLQKFSDKTEAKYEEFKELTTEKYNELSTELRAKYDQAKQKADELRVKAGDKYEEYAAMTEDKYNQLSEEAKLKYDDWRTQAESTSYNWQQEANNKVAQMSVDQTEGLIAGNDVYGDNGSLIVAGGQQIDKVMIERAKQTGKEESLVAATNLSSGSALGNKVSASAGQTFDEAKAQAKNWWERVKSTTKDLAGKAADKVEEERINRALGRPVTRVILDHNDQVVLNTGEIITREVVKNARSANVLELLLSSADTSKPDFSKEDRSY